MGPQRPGGSARNSLDVAESLLPPLLTPEDLKAPHLGYVNTRLVLQSELEREETYFLSLGCVVRCWASPNSHPAVRGNLQGLQFRCGAGAASWWGAGRWGGGPGAGPQGAQTPGCAIGRACRAPGTAPHVRRPPDSPLLEAQTKTLPPPLPAGASAWEPWPCRRWSTSGVSAPRQPSDGPPSDARLPSSERAAPHGTHCLPALHCRRP